ncbi:CCHC-type domain-containing protein [Citrus sinensis]|nr:CCHC-type domain-containing protein [Citrus sinensis]
MANNERQSDFNINNGYASMSIDDEEDDGLIIAGEDIDDGNKVNIDYRCCLVGRFLTDKVINFAAMKNTMASLWRPRKGVCIKDLSPTLFLFQFFHEIDINRVLETGPWTFDQHILLVKRLDENEQPQNVPLFLADFWIQIYNLPIGFMSEKILKNIGDYVGIFLDSDEHNFMGVWRTYMRIRASIDVRKPLKRMMKLKKEGGEWIWIDFKYERLNIFCFICGLLGHTEKQCPKLYDCPSSEIVKVYGHWLKAPSRRSLMNSGEKWLRSTMPEENNNGKGNSEKFAGAMAVDLVINANSGANMRNIRDYSINAGIEGINKESNSLITIGRHLHINEKSTMGIINDLSEEKILDEEREARLIVNESKRRRSQGGLRSSVGFEDTVASPEMDISVEGKNGQSVGLVIKAHREQ